jgi:hypothetical protein
LGAGSFDSATERSQAVGVDPNGEADNEAEFILQYRANDLFLAVHGRQHGDFVAREHGHYIVHQK